MVTGTRWLLPGTALEDDSPVAARFGAFAGALPHAVWAIRFAVPLPVDLPLDAAVAHFVAHAVVVDANDAFARIAGHEKATMSSESAWPT